MLKINLINIDTNTILCTYDSRKKTTHALRDEARDKLGQLVPGFIFPQGTIKYLDCAPTIPLYQKGSTMWWTAVKEGGKYQYEIVSQ